jgi:hypothetical protein
VAVAGEVAHDRLEFEERTAAGVALVAGHDRRPLLRRHRAGAGVGQQVDHHVLGAHQEQVVVRRGEHAHAFVGGGDHGTARSP